MTRPPKDPAYLAALHQIPCCICTIHGMTQNSPTEAHHVKSGRYSQAKTADGDAIALCHSHHHKLRAYPGDEGKIGFHNAQETWEGLYGPDYTYSAWCREMVGRLF